MSSARRWIIVWTWGVIVVGEAPQNLPSGLADDQAVFYAGSLFDKG
jgi:hypothetical protein